MKRGLVIKSTGSWFSVLDSGNVISCRIKGKLRLLDIKTTNPVTVGDRVFYSLQEEGTGIIEKIEERKNYIIRKATQFHKEAHLIAANIDILFLMTTLKFPETQTEFIDRFLLTAEAYHIESIILINKIDLLDIQDKIDLEKFISTYSLAGYKCIQVSVSTGTGVDEVLELMHGKINLLAGNSGVGKSSLINKLIPELELKTNTISDTHHSGKHTTTFSELFTLNDNSYIIDSPGIRGFGLIDLTKEEIGLYYPEIFRISKDCKFYNCSHTHEPGCAVRDAVYAGKIGESRYKSYINIVMEDKSKYR